MSLLEDNIVPYVQAYIKRFNQLCGELSSLGMPASLYSDPIYSAVIQMAADGIAVVYFSEKMAKAGELQQGVHADDWKGRSLAYLIQASTGNLLKVSGRLTGVRVKADLSNFRESVVIPPNLPAEEACGGINPEALEWFLKNSQGGLKMSGMAISPRWRHEKGLAKEALPTRGHVFSPAIPTMPDNRLVLQFIFQFMDVLWQPEKLALDAEAGYQYAEMDLQVLRLGVEAGIPAKALAEDPFESVAQHVDRVCGAFRTLLDGATTEENDVQAFLEQQGHSFLIAPVHNQIVPHKRLRGGQFIADFMVEKAGADYHFVEIESPKARPYQAKGEEISAPFRHAIQQVEDWLRYLDENLDSARREDCLPGLYKPTGEVVIGRSSQLGETANRRFQYTRAESKRILLKTYDMVLEEAIAYAHSLRRMKTGSGAY
jgi:hypothetical protein